nr:receptor type tyrosine protein phosphatase S [Hymenolepis microstoma]
MVTYNVPSFDLQEFRITDTQDGQSRTLSQFQFSDWADNGVSISKSTETLIVLISQVHKTQTPSEQSEDPMTIAKLNCMYPLQA